MKKVCPICDSVNRSTAFFCHACGSRLLTTIPKTNTASRPAVALAGEENSPAVLPEPSEPAETTAEIEPIYDEKAEEIEEAEEAEEVEEAEEAEEAEEVEEAEEAKEIDHDEITEIYDKDQESKEAEKAEPNEAPALSKNVEVKAEALKPDISTGKLTPELLMAEAAPTATSSAEAAPTVTSSDEAAATATSSDELSPLSDESEAVALEAYDTEESHPDLPPPVASEEEDKEKNEEPAPPLSIEAESVTETLVSKEIDTDELVSAPSVVSFKKKTTGSSQERQNTTVLALPPELEAKDEAAKQTKQETEEEKEQENPPAASSETATALKASPSESQLSALPAGTLIAERFETIELLESDGQSNLYAVYDRAACPSCGSTENQPDDNYCWECGFDFSRGHQLVSCELREALSDDELDGYEGERFVDHERFYLRQEEDTTLANPPTTQPVQSAPEPQSISLSVGYQSDTGMVRQLNEDSLSVFVLTGLYESLSKPALGLFIVADGMGGHAGGEIASKFVVQTITERLVRRVLLHRFNATKTTTNTASRHSPREEAIKPRVEEAIRYANEQLYRLAQERYSDMGSTVTLALVVDHRAYIANVGDSRVYIHRNGQLQQITKDHSVVASLIAAGMAQPHEIYTHPERNVVYRSMGNRPTVELDIWEEELKKGDKIVLCSDGLWEAIHNEGIEEILLTYPQAQAATEEMVKRANLAGGEDNITVILAGVG